MTDTSVPNSLVARTRTGEVPIEFSTSGAISDGDRQGVVDLVEQLLSTIDEPVQHVRVRMDHRPDRNRDRTTIVRAVIDLRSGSIRAHVAADTTHAALADLGGKLAHQLRHLIDRQRSLAERAHAHDGSWRHGMEPTARPDFFPRPADEREIVRHKSVAPDLTTVEEALFDLRMMDYDFYLYRDAATERDALVYVTDDGARVLSVGGHAVPRPAPDDVELDPHEVPTSTVDEARERLDAGHEPFVFFVDASTERGHVLYRRYDGHYSLLVPQDEEI